MVLGMTYLENLKRKECERDLMANGNPIGKYKIPWCGVLVPLFSNNGEILVYDFRWGFMCERVLRWMKE